MKEIIINKFDGGISRDIREPIESKFAITKHFDIFSYPNRLVPYRSTEPATTIGADTTALKQYDVRTFQYASDGALYALGKQPASSTRVKVLKNADPTDIVWTAPATAEGGLNNSRNWLQCFIEWQGAFWMFGGTTSVSKWVMGSTFTDTVATVGTINHVAQGVIAPDDNLYMFYNNKVVRVSNTGTVTDAVLTLPSDGRITSATVYGNYLAIAWAKGTTSSGVSGVSKVFIWDLVSPDISDVIGWGEGQLLILANLEGRLIGVSDVLSSYSVGMSSGSIIIRGYSGGTPSVLEKIICTHNGSNSLRRDVVIKENKLYFIGKIPFNTSTSSDSTYNLGIYCFGRRDVNSNYALTLDYIEENVDTSQFNINSFGNAGNYWWINHSADGSVTKTNDQASYTFTSFYESQKLNCGDSSKNKSLLGVAVSYNPLLSAGQVIMKYKKDAETSWTTIFTDTTDNSTYHESTNIESTGVPLPSFHEIQFRLESTGGAEITELKFQYEEINSLLN